jgi:tryptophan halogenase
MFAENSWIQVMMGQGLMPTSHHPISRQMDDTVLADFLGEVRKEVARNLMKLPRHHAFVKQFCPATPPADSAPAQPAAKAATVGFPLQLNPAPRIQVQVLANGQKVFIIDDFLRNADEVATAAAAASAHFGGPAGHPYPGPRLPLPEALSAQLDGYFQQHLREVMGFGAPLGMQACFSRVTQDPATLDPRQRICHRDDSALQPHEAMAALVHYLFRDEQLGGTVFFKPLLPADETRRLLDDANQLDGTAFQARYGVAPGYMTESNRCFEVIGRVPARWNRAVFYDGAIFHSGDIRAVRPAYLAGMGRLTLNGFFMSQRGPR